MLAAAPKRRRPGPLGKNLLLGEEVRTCVTRSQGREFSALSLGVGARAPGITAHTASAFGERFPALPGESLPLGITGERLAAVPPTYSPPASPVDKALPQRPRAAVKGTTPPVESVGARMVNTMRIVLASPHWG